MRFWTSARITGWVSVLVGCIIAAHRIYQAKYNHEAASAAQLMHTKPDCTSDCMRPDTVNVLLDVLPFTVFVMLILVGAIIGFYCYLWRDLRVVAELSKQQK